MQINAHLDCWVRVEEELQCLRLLLREGRWTTEIILAVVVVVATELKREVTVQVDTI